MVPTTRSMAISNELKEYFEKLIAPLATNSSMELMLNKIEDFTKKFDDIITEQNSKIENLTKRVEELEGTVSLQKSTMANLELMQDNIESYSRRSCLRIHGIPVEEKEENEKPLSILEGCYKEMDLTFDPQEIDRFHWVGQEYNDRVTGKKVKSLIVKFKSWKSLEKFYRARPRTYVNGKKKPGRPLF